MKFFRRIPVYVIALAGVWSARGDLAEWVRHIETASRVEQVFFREMALPAGPVLHRRPPQETRTDLTSLIATAPTQADLYSLRARENELLLDFAAAEADWKKYAELAQDKSAASLGLADYYHRQLKVDLELQALSAAAASATETGSVPIFSRMLTLADRQLIAPERTEAIYRQWRDKQPKSPEVQIKAIDYLTARKEYARAQAWIDEFAKRFPEDSSAPVRMKANLEQARGNTQQSLDIYDQNFRPLETNQDYFDLLRKTRTIRGFLNKARAAAAANPVALDPATRIFHFYLQEANPGAAQRTLIEFRLRKESQKSPWTAAELRTLAGLWSGMGNDVAEAARYYYALYSLPGGSASDQQASLEGLADALLRAPEQRLAIGAGGLGYYKDIATADAGPGFLNGILSLLLNNSNAAYRFSEQERQAIPYFERARAAELIDLLERRFPQAKSRDRLRAGLIDIYANYGQHDPVIRHGRAFLTAFPESPYRTEVALKVANAHASKGQAREEVAVYESLLVELAKKAEGIPLGDGILTRAPAPEGQPEQPVRGPSSPNYARVLDHYISRLVSLNRTRDAVAVIRKEIDRNPNDPGLYERLAAFLDQNKMGAEIEAVYRNASGRFQDRTWHHKLARFYLRQKQMAQFGNLTGEIAKVFSGSELERYFREVVATSQLDAVLYRQVNLYAHQRFPHNLTFVANLLSAYQRRGTADPVAWERLIRRYWFYDESLRAQFFEFLQRTGKLRAELQALSTAPANPAGVRMLGEANTWRSHFEEAAPKLKESYAQAPGDLAAGGRVSSLYRSLAAYDKGMLTEAETMAVQMTRAAPRDVDAFTRLGEIRMERAARGGNATFHSLTENEPGASEGYVEAATLLWDYFEFDEALRAIERGRQRLGPDLLSYEAGAIHENKRQFDKAIEEYVKGALAQPGGSPSQDRLLRLARRPALRASIDAMTAKLVEGAEPRLEGVLLRMALLAQQERRQDLEAMLLALIGRTQSADLLSRLGEEGRNSGFANVEERALQRQIQLTADPIEKMRARIDLARFYESRRNPAQAAQTIDAVYRENPLIAGVVRTAVNYHWRNRNYGRGLEILNAAAAAAHPSLKPAFTFEAARKATEANEFARARTLLTGLLTADPFSAPYLGAMADTYAREGDEASLRAFYDQKIAALGNAPLPADQRIARVAAMRRALAGVLERGKNYAGALDQYIEVLNRYPEDSALIDEVIGFARRNGQQARLLDAYRKTTAASPKDFRYHVVLARSLAAFEDYPGAIAAYSRATDIRPDKLDLFVARAALEERLMRFDEAAATFTKVYDLSYRNSDWMARVAQIRARQGRSNDAVAALRQAFVDPNPNSPSGYFEAAVRLESWDILEPARQLAERGSALAGAGLMERYSGAAQTYARILVRQRRWDALKALDPAGKLLSSAAGSVGHYYPPEEKARFAAWLTTAYPEAAPGVGMIAGLAEWEAKRLHQLMLAERADTHMGRLIELQRKRLVFSELASQLEAYWKVRPVDDQRAAVLAAAADAYRDAGDTANEMRLRAQLTATPAYLRTLVQRNPQRLLQLAARGPRDAAAAAAIESGSAELALAAVQARGQGLPPVWTKSYTGLVGIYFGLRTPNIEAAFRDALGGFRIGDRIGRPADRQQQLAGDDWYYYAGRFGEYLDFLKRSEAADLAPAELERSPGTAQGYFQVGEYWRTAGRLREAMEEFEYVLQLEPDHVAAIDRIARIHAAEGRREQAVTRWREGLGLIVAQLGHPRLDGFQHGLLAEILDQIEANKLTAELRAECERTVAEHLKRLGGYQSAAVVEKLVRTAANPAAAAGLLEALSRQLREPEEFLAMLASAKWLTPQQRESVFTRLLEVTGNRAASAVGEGRETVLTNHYNWQERWLTHLVDSGQMDRVRTAIASLSEDGRERLRGSLQPLEIRMAASAGRLDALIDSFRVTPGAMPAPYVLRDVAIQLREKGDAANARRLLRFYYEYQLERGGEGAPAFLGLAELLLETGDTAGAVSQLRRMTLVTEAFANHSDAGRLLQRFGKHQEAAVFFAEAVKAAPWDAAARLALAESQLAQNAGDAGALAALKGVAASELAPARVRRTAQRAPVPNTVAELEALIRQDPEESVYRVKLFSLARAAGRHVLAVAALESLHQAGGAMRGVFAYRAGYSDNASYLAGQFLPVENVTKSERAARARELADSLAKTDRVGGAYAMRLVADALEPNAQNTAQIKLLRAAFERDRQNVERRPMIHEQVAQQTLVRPMLVSGGAR